MNQLDELMAAYDEIDRLRATIRRRNRTIRWAFLQFRLRTGMRIQDAGEMLSPAEARLLRGNGRRHG